MLTTGGSAILQQVRNSTLPVRDVIDEMPYDMGCLWILEEACVEKMLENVACLKMSAHKTLENKGLWKTMH